MKQLSATDASRRFSEVLDNVERSGESFVVMRHGRAVATIGPANGGGGKALKEALRVNRPDGAWVDELRDLREGLEPVRDPWRG
ncbi:MAG TPA: type II toxin-antitoxin system Phd/YefM family antitoxin [Solirubrobacterales bacterium]|nr:type II toxin-antitoxin system Phd/YefM family antitoxin [Solirubrobacterales bacterium]